MRRSIHVARAEGSKCDAEDGEGFIRHSVSVTNNQAKAQGDVNDGGEECGFYTGCVSESGHFKKS
jgi:hypothetical protein